MPRNKRGLPRLPLGVDLVPFGYEFMTALPAYVGSPYLFWHDAGEPYSSFAPTFNKLVNKTVAWAKANRIEFQRFCFHDLRHRHAVDCSSPGAASTRCRAGLGTPRSRPRKCISTTSPRRKRTASSWGRGHREPPQRPGSPQNPPQATLDSGNESIG